MNPFEDAKTPIATMDDVDAIVWATTLEDLRTSAEEDMDEEDHKLGQAMLVEFIQLLRKNVKRATIPAYVAMHTGAMVAHITAAAYLDACHGVEDHDPKSAGGLSWAWKTFVAPVHPGDTPDFVDLLKTYSAEAIAAAIDELSGLEPNTMEPSARLEIILMEDAKAVDRG